jgi:hypothetical protein
MRRELKLQSVIFNREEFSQSHNDLSKRKAYCGSFEMAGQRRNEILNNASIGMRSFRRLMMPCIDQPTTVCFFTMTVKNESAGSKIIAMTTMYEPLLS